MFRGPRGSSLSGGLVLVAAILAGTAGIAVGASGAGRTTISADLSYSCQFPSGAAAVRVVVTAAFPSAAAPGQQIQPTGVQITADLPQAAVGYLRSLGAITVTGSSSLRTVETDQGHSMTDQWPARAPAADPLPATGGLRLTEPGTAPAARAGSSGTMTFTAGGLVLALSPRKADGTATTPATVRVTCTLTPATSGSGGGTAANGRLAAIPVTAASPSPSPSGSPSSQPGRLPPGCGKIKAVGHGIPTCGYITGYSDVAKLHGAALLQPKRPARPGLVNLDFAERFQLKPGILIEHSTAELYFQGRHELPPVTATFLAFRFVPVTATLRLVELTPIKIVSVSGITAPPFPITVRASTTISVRVSSVRVNGVPLDVGSHCQTATPMRLVLIGKGDNTLPPRGYTVSTGGPLTGTATIPPFTGCGVSENLDPLFTGSISGPGNFVKMTQGKLCGPSQPQNWTCPPPVPEPQR